MTSEDSPTQAFDLQRIAVPTQMSFVCHGERRTIPLNRELLVGSSSGTLVQVPDPTMSRRHFRVELHGGSVRICDLESRNGTYVDGTRIRLAELVGRCKVRAGRTEFVFDSAEDNRASRPVYAQRGGWVVASEALRSVVERAARYARVDWPILIHGESGVGKEGLAHLIHRESGRAGGPWVCVNAATLTHDLVESELFGHDRGAFTGATSSRAGAFERAHDGTLFLDEIGELPPEVQSKLLRVLENKTVERLGGSETRNVNFRLVCATHRDLAEMVRAGTFREDLWFRLARLVLRIPPLRERGDDLLALADRFLDEIGYELGGSNDARSKPTRRGFDYVLGDTARRALLGYSWPGNVRELRNVLSWAAINSDSAVIEEGDLIPAFAAKNVEPSWNTAQAREVLRLLGGNLSQTAKALGVPRSTLRDRLRFGSEAS